MKITYKDVEYQIAFGMSAFKMLKEDTGVDIPDIIGAQSKLADDTDAFSVDDLDIITKMVMAGIKNGCRKDRVDMPEMDEYDAIDLFSEPGFIHKVMIEFSQSMPTADPNTNSPIQEKKQ